MDKEKNITVKELMSSFYDRDVENLTLSQIFTIRSLLEQPHPTDVGWGFHGLAPVKPR